MCYLRRSGEDCDAKLQDCANALVGQPTNLETDVGGLLSELLTNDFLVETLANDIDQQIEESNNNTQVVLKITPTKGTFTCLEI